MTSEKDSEGLLCGDLAPDFTLEDKGGNSVTLSSFRGKSVILYFYPKDDTPGCTQEACDFRDSSFEISDSKAIVLGISPDKAESHARFSSKYNLPFNLLADSGKEIHKTYGAWGAKKLYGREYEGVIRSTFLIDSAGNIANIWRNVRVKGHVEKVVAALGEIR